jgi:hypothetical protein
MLPLVTSERIDSSSRNWSCDLRPTLSRSSKSEHDIDVYMLVRYLWTDTYRPERHRNRNGQSPQFVSSLLVQLLLTLSLYYLAVRTSVTIRTGNQLSSNVLRIPWVEIVGLFILEPLLSLSDNHISASDSDNIAQWQIVMYSFLFAYSPSKLNTHTAEEAFIKYLK